MAKSIAKSIRMTDEVYKFVEGFKGNGFNEKFENLVIFCMKEEKEIQKNVAWQKKTCEANQKRIDFQRKLLSDLECIANSVKYLLDASRGAEVSAKGVKLKKKETEDSESVTQKASPESSPGKKNESQGKSVTHNTAAASSTGKKNVSQKKKRAS